MLKLKYLIILLVLTYIVKCIFGEYNDKENNDLITIINFLPHLNYSSNNLIKNINLNIIDLKKVIYIIIYDFINSDIFSNKYIKYNLLLSTIYYNHNSKEEGIYNLLLKKCHFELKLFVQKNNYNILELSNINIFTSENIIFLDNKNTNLNYYYIILEIKNYILTINEKEYNVYCVFYVKKTDVYMFFYKDKIMSYDVTVIVSFYCECTELNSEIIRSIIDFKNIDISK